MAIREESTDPLSTQALPDDMVRQLRDAWQMVKDGLISTSTFRKIVNQEVGSKINNHETRLTKVERRQGTVANLLKRAFTQIIKGLDGQDD